MDREGLTFALPADTKFSASPKMVEIFNHAIESDAKIITIDATRAYWVSPFTACWFAALRDKLEERGKSLTVNPPSRGNAIHQWERLGISSYLGMRLIPDFGKSVPSFRVARLTEPSYPLASDVTRLLTEKLKGAENFHKALHFVIREVIDNSFEHGRVNSCYMAAYSVPTKNLVRLCIFDCGIGVAASLRENTKYHLEESDLILTKLSLERGVSGKSSDRGIGLYLMSDTVSKNAGAEFSVLSGNALIKVSHEGIAERHITAPMKGTVVKLKLKTKERFNFISVSEWEEL